MVEHFLTWVEDFWEAGSKGVPGRESRTGSRLVSPVMGRKKKFGNPMILVKKMNPGCKMSTIGCLNITVDTRI
jgi:hypothetical protein